MKLKMTVKEFMDRSERYDEFIKYVAILKVTRELEPKEAVEIAMNELNEWLKQDHSAVAAFCEPQNIPKVFMGLFLSEKFGQLEIEGWLKSNKGNKGGK